MSVEVKLLQLEYFHAVCKYKSFRKAASVLDVSQPAVSTAVIKLERELGVPLFERGAKSIELTIWGEIVYTKAATICEEIGSLYRELAEAGGKEYIVRLAFFQCEDLPLRIASMFTVVHPEVHVVMEQRNSRMIVPALIRNEYDVGITYSELTTPELDSYPYQEIEFGVFFHRGHPFEKTDCVVPRQLADVNPWMLSTTNLVEKTLGDYCETNQIPMVFDQASDTGENLIEYLKASRYDQVALLPLDLKIEGDMIVSRPLDPPLRAEMSVIWDKRQPPNENVLALVRFLSGQSSFLPSP